MCFCKNNRLPLFFVSNPVVGTTSKSSTRASKRWYFRLIWTKLSDVRACLKFRFGTVQNMPKSCPKAILFAVMARSAGQNIMFFASKLHFLRKNYVFCFKITFFASKSCFSLQNHVILLQNRVFCFKITFFHP